MTDRELMQMALQALEDYKKHTSGVMIPQTRCQGDEAIITLRERLSQPEPEPVWCDCGDAIIANDGALCGTCASARGSALFQAQEAAKSKMK